MTNRFKSAHLSLLLMLTLVVSLACVCGRSTLPSAVESESTQEIEGTPTPVPAVPTPPPLPHPIVAKRLYVSPLPADLRMWAALPSSDIARSDDGGRTWSIPYPPPDPPYLECAEIVPVETDGLYCIESTYELWYINREGWFEIELPLPFPSIRDIAAAPDGSGRLVAVGGDPDGRNNAWVREGPIGETWQGIAVPADNWATLTSIAWLPEYGLWASNETGSVLRADDALGEWQVTVNFGELFEGLSRIWVSSDGSLRLSGFFVGIQVWTGNTWTPLDIGSAYVGLDPPYVSDYPPPVAVLPGRAEFARAGVGSGFARSQDGGATWEAIPMPEGLPDRVSINDLAVLGNTVYLATDMGLYMSEDAGESWKPVPETP